MTKQVAPPSCYFSVHARKGVKQRKRGGENEETDSSGRSQLSLPAHFLLKLCDSCLNPETAQTSMWYTVGAIYFSYTLLTHFSTLASHLISLLLLEIKKKNFNFGKTDLINLELTYLIFLFGFCSSSVSNQTETFS